MTLEQAAHIEEYKKLQMRHDVSGWLLFLLIALLVGGFYLWGRKVNYDQSKLQEALATVEHLEHDLAKVTKEVNSRIINLGLESRIVADASGTIILCSPTAAEVCGYRPNELLGKPAHILVAQEYVRGHAEAFANAFKNDDKLGTVSIVRCMLRKKDGSTRPVEVIVRMVEDSDGKRAVVTLTPVEKIQFTPALPDSVKIPSSSVRPLDPPAIARS